MAEADFVTPRHRSRFGDENDMADIGPYSRPQVLAKLDGRTREARLLQSVRDELTDHLGGSLTVTQSTMVERAAFLTLHIALMDAKALESDGLSERDSRQYLAWNNALMRIMKSLGTDKPKAKPAAPSLKDFLTGGVTTGAGLERASA
jgi:hypothetical protein